MTEFVVPPPPVSSVAVEGTQARFPVRRIFCVGRNYAAHAREMGRDPDREPPFFFLKPADTVVDDGATVPYPPETENFHHEIELVVAIGKDGRDIPPEPGATSSSPRASRGAPGIGARVSTCPPP
jgi:fumarylpyruvate hydrolase